MSDFIADLTQRVYQMAADIGHPAGVQITIGSESGIGFIREAAKSVMAARFAAAAVGATGANYIVYLPLDTFTNEPALHAEVIAGDLSLEVIETPWLRDGGHHVILVRDISLDGDA